MGPVKEWAATFLASRRILSFSYIKNQSKKYTINLNYCAKLSALLTVGSLSVGSLSAQFFQANALEAQAYGGLIDQGFVAVSAASDFALASISSGSGFFAECGA
ncbi:MAG: hypothetical protein ACI9ZV_000444 [Candidatus Azotimanducaceae bacterium]|jgi:hypothetical protein